MRRPRGGALVALAGLLAPALALGAGAPAGASSISRSPTRLLAATSSAVKKAGSMTFTDRSVSGKVTETYSGAVSATTAAETLTATGEPALQVVLVDQVIYIRAGSTVLENSLDLSPTAAAAEAGKWISVQSSDAPFAGLASQLTVASELTAYFPASKRRIGKASSVAHHPVITVYGDPSASAANGATAGSAALFLSAKAPYLPVGGSLILAKSGSAERKEVAVFKNWGKPFSVIAPTSPVSYDSLTG